MKILVPLDGSQTAEAALPIALRLAGERKRSIVLVAVANVRTSEKPAPAEPEIAPVQDARSYLETAKSHLAAGTGDVVTAVWTGPAAAAIIKAAETYGVDMIVMTTHGRTGRERDMFGSVADAVLRNAPTPVLVLRQRVPVAREVAAGAGATF
jgi:nucleotide-binding universal stress UspA family protein